MLTNNHYLLNSQGSRFLIFSVPSLSGKSYTSYDEISAALVNGEVSGALIDTYVLGSRKDLFENPSLRLIKIYDYSTAYGVVLGGEAKKLTQCFRKYVQSNKEKIFQTIQEHVEFVEVRKEIELGNLSTRVFETATGRERFAWQENIVS